MKFCVWCREPVSLYILFQTLHTLSNKFSKALLTSSQFPHSVTHGTALKISTSIGALVKNRTLEQDCLDPPFISHLNLRQATKLLCAYL